VKWWSSWSSWPGPAIGTCTTSLGAAGTFSTFYRSTGQALSAGTVHGQFQRRGIPLGPGHHQGAIAWAARAHDRRVPSGSGGASKALPQSSIRGPVVTAGHQVSLQGATVNDQLSACTSLAAILEQCRLLLKEHLFTKDEGALFTAANEFKVQHVQAGQVVDDD
jgi:hypothetical protein